VGDSETVSVTVGGSCDAVAITDLTSDSPVKIGEAMRFTATVTGTMPYTYTWDFGDGGAGSGSGLDTATPTWIYASTGPYTVTLGVDNPCGSDSETEVVRVEPHAIFLPVVLKTYP
jgi:PKD repeat protein